MAAYCAQDVELTLAIFKLMHGQFPAVEIELVDATIRMFCQPVLQVDIPRVKAELARELAEREALLLSIDTTGFDEKKLTRAERELAPHAKRLLTARKIIGSNDAFAALLVAQGAVPPVKISPAWMKKPRESRRDEDKWAFAFAKDDEQFLALADDTDNITLPPAVVRTSEAGVALLAQRSARIAQLVECRLAVKSTTNITRAQRFLTAGQDPQGRHLGALKSTGLRPKFLDRLKDVGVEVEATTFAFEKFSR